MCFCKFLRTISWSPQERQSEVDMLMLTDMFLIKYSIIACEWDVANTIVNSRGISYCDRLLYVIIRAEGFISGSETVDLLIVS